MAAMNPNGPNWLGLLKWSLSQSDGTTSTSEIHPMSPEDKLFLENVMKDLVKDEGHRLCEILQELTTLVDLSLVSDEEKLFNLLEETQTMIDQIDMAQVFVKFGGIKILKIILTSSIYTEEQLKCLTCILLGELSQNNPLVQDQMFQYGIIDELCLLCMTSGVISSKLCLKALYGLSCVIRGHRSSEYRFFHELNGPNFLYRLLQRDEPTSTVKVLFFLGALISSDFATASMVSGYCDLCLDLCYSFLQLNTTDMRCESTLQLLSSLTHSPNGRRYLHQHQSRVVSELERKSRMIQEEQQTAPEEDYSPAIDMIVLITDTIKRGIDDLPPVQTESTPSAETLRLCG
jgi:hypothetical protein